MLVVLKRRHRPPPSRYRLSATVSMATTDIIFTKNTSAGDSSENTAGLCRPLSVCVLLSAVWLWLRVVGVFTPRSGTRAADCAGPDITTVHMLPHLTFGNSSLCCQNEEVRCYSKIKRSGSQLVDHGDFNP